MGHSRTLASATEMPGGLSLSMNINVRDRFPAVARIPGGSCSPISTRRPLPVSCSRFSSTVTVKPDLFSFLLKVTLSGMPE